MIDWNIQARAHACQACQKPFVDKQPFHTLLFDERQGYHRLDVCEDCWKEQYGQGAVDKKGFISHWQSVYTPPPAAPPEAIQKDTAETLLRKLVEQNAPEHAGARYILAVMLERKRILKVKTQVMENGARIFIYEHGKTGDLFSIPDPKLELNHLEQVQKDVAYLLEHGLNASSATPASASVSPVGDEVTSPPLQTNDERLVTSSPTETGGKSENPEGMEPAQTNGV
jgi:hypothetical protein